MLLWPHKPLNKQIVEYFFLFLLVQKFKNRASNARVIIENEMARLYGSQCIIIINTIFMSVYRVAP